jgi:type II secretory pathway component GspD/PulD (secretin)
MAIVRGGAIQYQPDSVLNLQTAQTGNADSTNTADRGTITSGAMLKVVSTIGATPTVTLNIQGSVDGSTFFNIPYALVATPSTFVVTAITITTATTNNYILQSAQPWRFLKLVMSANTNVTLTSDLYLRGV